MRWGLAWSFDNTIVFPVSFAAVLWNDYSSQSLGVQATSLDGITLPTCRCITGSLCAGKLLACPIALLMLDGVGCFLEWPSVCEWLLRQLCLALRRDW
jgi:hypothetical protein